MRLCKHTSWRPQGQMSAARCTECLAKQLLLEACLLPSQIQLSRHEEPLQDGWHRVQSSRTDELTSTRSLSTPGMSAVMWKALSSCRAW